MPDPDRTETTIVLVVEDEPLLRLFATDMIEDAGYDVLSAASAADAIAILEGRHDIRVVFTDVHMPGGLDGIDLAIGIRERWPAIRLIVTSGKPLPPRSVIPPEAVFFAKPYRQDTVLEALRTMVA